MIYKRFEFVSHGFNAQPMCGHLLDFEADLNWGANYVTVISDWVEKGVREAHFSCRAHLRIKLQQKREEMVSLIRNCWKKFP